MYQERWPKRSTSKLPFSMHINEICWTLNRQIEPFIGYGIRIFVVKVIDFSMKAKFKVFFNIQGSLSTILMRLQMLITKIRFMYVPDEEYRLLVLVN